MARASVKDIRTKLIFLLYLFVLLLEIIPCFFHNVCIIYLLMF